jgi:hypothetical protein
MRTRAQKRTPGAAALAWGVLFFVAAQLALAVTVERCRPELRDLEYGTKRARLRARLAEEPGRPLCVFLGSSRVAWGFRPELLPDDLPGRPVVFNLALVGAGPVQQLLCLRRLLAEGVRPRWVVLECWPPYWDQDGEFAEAERVTVSGLGWQDLSVLGGYWPRPAELYGEWALARAVPCYSSRLILLHQYARGLLPPCPLREDGWQRMDRSGWLLRQGLGEEPQECRRRADHTYGQFAPALRDFVQSEESDRALRETLALCREEGIAAALLFMPETREFQGWYPPAVREQVDAYLARLSGEYGVALIDARDWVPDADFGDAYHLLPRGAAAFTERCGREALPRLLAGE